MNGIEVEKVSLRYMENLRNFVNLLSGNNKYSLLNSGNLLQHFLMQLSQKWKKFSEFLFKFSKFRFNFEHFQEKDDGNSFNKFLNLRTLKNVVR